MNKNRNKPCTFCGYSPWKHENEKAAIAAGLSPDTNMRDPANLWRALENITLPIIGRNPQTGNWDCMVIVGRHHSRHTHFERTTLTDAVFAALVALYDAEHPNQP